MQRSSPFLVLGLALCAARLEAQAVRGVLADRGTGQPIPSAFVTLLDEADFEVARALTGLGGTFLLQAPAPGTYRLRSKRIGFRPSESPSLQLVEGETIEFGLEIEAVPIELPAVIVRGRPHCGAKPEAATAAAQLWEEAREALSAVRWTQAQSTLWYTVQRFQRTFPRRGWQVIAQRDSTWSGLAQRPFQSTPAEELAQKGFVVAAPGDSLDFHGPDADVLLGDVFLATHCFNVADGGLRYPGLVGLSFEPEPKRELPDIAGTLWLNRPTLELEFIEFNYTRLPDPTLGGRVEFLRLASGPWIVKHWWLRMPQVRPDRRGGLRRPPPKIVGYHQGGGMVTAIQSADGVEYAAAVPVLKGHVADGSRGGSPLAQAIVAISGTHHQAVTDEGGRFELVGPFDGDYGVTFRHARLDSLGISADEQRVALTPGATRTLTLQVPPESVVVRRHCPKARHPDARVIIGVVRDSAFTPVPSARIEVQLPGRNALRGGRADDAGRYAICDVPLTRFTVVARDGDLREGQVTLEFQAEGVRVEELQFYPFTGRIWTQDVQVRAVSLRPGDLPGGGSPAPPPTARPGGH